MESSNSWRTKLWSSIALCQSGSKYARKEQRREEKQSEENKGQQLSLLSHFWSTYWSPFSTFYIPFQISGSQESNASNGVWIGAEIRKIWPSQDNCIQLKDKFASCEFGTPTCEIKAQLAKVILQLANLELNVRKWIPSCEINLRDFRKSPCNVWNLHAKWDICAPTLLDLFLRYFCINFHSSPCNPPTIRFLS